MEWRQCPLTASIRVSKAQQKPVMQAILRILKPVPEAAKVHVRKLASSMEDGGTIDDAYFRPSIPMASRSSSVPDPAESTTMHINAWPNRQFSYVKAGTVVASTIPMNLQPWSRCGDVDGLQHRLGTEAGGVYDSQMVLSRWREWRERTMTRRKFNIFDSHLGYALLSNDNNSKGLENQWTVLPVVLPAPKHSTLSISSFFIMSAKSSQVIDLQWTALKKQTKPNPLAYAIKRRLKMSNIKWLIIHIRDENYLLWEIKSWYSA